MVKGRGQPRNSAVAAVTLSRCADMGNRLAAGGRSVVARGACSDHIRMVDMHGRPVCRDVAAVAVARACDVPRALAGCRRAIVAA